MAQNAVEQLIHNSVFSMELRASRQSALSFVQLLKSYTEKRDTERLFSAFDATQLQYTVNQFKTVLLAEMETLNSHFVTQKRGYDTLALISFAEIIFPAELSTKVPDAVADVREAGKCIAFELPTAAGFHLQPELRIRVEGIPKEPRL
ncbi:MAG: hypothetical protein JO007_16585 [Alphaproteobacteria bacterium]|nr:hypothetical protein [Alphaproteobacteria bacterium]